MTLKDCKILDRQVLLQKGSFTIVRYWIAEWVNLEGSVKHILGWTGKETELTRSEIKPVVIFEVKGVNDVLASKEVCKGSRLLSFAREDDETSSQTTVVRWGKWR